MKIILIVVLLIGIIAVKSEMITNTIKSGNTTITTSTDTTTNYTKRVVQDGQTAPTTYAYQGFVTKLGYTWLVGSILRYESANIIISAYRTDNAVTLQIWPSTLFIYIPTTLIINVTGLLNTEFYPGLGSCSEYRAGWPIFINDNGGDNIGKIFWYGNVCGGNTVAYFRVYGVNAGNFGSGDFRGFEITTGISFFKY